MMFSQKSRMCKGSNRHVVSCQLVANIRRSEAVSHTCILCLFFSKLFSNGIDPFRYGYIRECCVLSLPCLVVEVRVLRVMTVLAMFPDRILPSVLDNRSAHINQDLRLNHTHSSEIIQTKSQVSGLRERVHDQKTIGKHTPYIGKVEQDIAIRLS